MNKKKFDLKWLVIIGISVFAIVSVGFTAYEITSDNQPQVINIDKVEFSGNVTFGGGSDASEVFGGTSHMTSDVDITGDLTVSGAMTFSGALSSAGENSLTGTTSVRWLDASFQVPLNFQQATSSDDNNVADQATQLLVGTYEHTGSDLLCTDVWVDIYTANGIFAYDMKVGTSTSATSSDAHLINATTDGHEIATTTTDKLSKEDDEGTSSDEVWDLNNGEFLSATQIFNAANATSAPSFTAAGGNATAGTLHVNCRSRY